MWQPCELLYTCYLLTYLSSLCISRHHFTSSNSQLYEQQNYKVLHRVITAVSATVTVRQKWPKDFDERVHCREAPSPKLPFLLERSGLPTNRWCIGPTHASPHPKQHLDQFSCFSTACVCVQQTNTATDTQTTMVTTRDVTRVS